MFVNEDETYLVLRAISDCNLPKFTSKDVPLFEAIISDLFPSIQKKQEDYGDLDLAIRQISKERDLVLKDVSSTPLPERTPSRSSSLYRDQADRQGALPSVANRSERSNA